MRLSSILVIILVLTPAIFEIGCAQRSNESCQSRMASKFSEFRDSQNKWYLSHNSEIPALPDQSQFIQGSNDRVDLLVHGFTSSPRAMHDLAEVLAAQGDTVILPLLTGFGVDGEAANQSTSDDWKSAFDQNLEISQTCGANVSVVSHSLGGAIVSDAVYNRGKSGIARLVFLAPFYKVADPKMAAAARMLANHVDVVDMKTLKSMSLGIDPYSWLPIPRPVPGEPEPYFPLKAMSSVLDMQTLFDKTVDPKSTIPVFLVTSEADSVVDSLAASEYLEKSATNLNRFTYAASVNLGHSFENRAGNPDFETLAEQIVEFVDSSKAPAIN